MKTKICTKCKIEKDVLMFNKRADSKCGVRSSCKECISNYEKLKKERKIKPKKEDKISKICPKCKIDKNFSEYGKNKNSKYGIASYCKECTKAHAQENIEKLRERDRLRYYKNINKRKSAASIKRERDRNNPDKVLQTKEYLKNYYQNNIEIIKKKNKQYQELHTEKCKKCRSEYYKNNKQEILNRQKEYYLNNKEIRIQKTTEWRKNNKEKYIATRRKRNKERYDNDPVYKLNRNIRSRINLVLKGKNKGGSTESLVGCSTEYLKSYLESKFVEGMGWENRSKWHIDHIRPCSSFDLSDPEQQKLCFHYTNLQPLWAKDNLKKSNKLNFKLENKNE